MDASLVTPKQGSRLAIYAITERDGMDRAFWTKIGAAFKNRDGSFNIMLDALPTNGRLHMREVDPNKKVERRDEEVHS
jgi:hypothetical protein